MGNAERVKPLTLIGPKGLEKVVNCLRVIAPELPFDIIYKEIDENEFSTDIDGLTLEAFKVNHSITCYGYSLMLPRTGKFSVERAKDEGIPVKLWNPLQKGETVEFDGKVYTPNMVLGPPRKGIKLTYCTDTRPISVIAEKAKGADLFICEGMYGEKDKQKKAVENRHMTFYEAASLAKEAGVKEMWLTHYSPSLVWPEQYLNEVREVFSNTKCAKDRKSVTLIYEDD